jgi:hypothetical protein
MALYSAIGVEFKRSLMTEFEALLDERIKTIITRTLKQVAHDYELNYKELKSRYCSKESLEHYELPGQTRVVTVDLEEHPTAAAAKKPVAKKPEPEPEPEAEAVPKEPKAKAASAVMALSKMKKGDLVAECESRGLDSEGTVSQLKERVKEARDKEVPESTRKKPKAKEPKAKEPKAKEPKEKKAPAPKKEKAPAKVKEKKVEVPPPPPVALEEEEPGDDDEDICQRVDDEDEFEFEEEDTEDDKARLQRNLLKILAEANEEEEDYEDED